MSTSFDAFAQNPFLASSPATASQSDHVELEEGAPALEISIAWGDDVLHLAHHVPPRDVWIGEEQGVDFELPSVKLGVGRLPLARVEGGQIVALVPRDADATITQPKARAITLDEARVSGLAAPSEIEGWDRVTLPFGAKLRFERGGFAFRVGHVAAAKKPVGAARGRRTALAFWAVSAAVHLGVVGALVLSPGASLDDDDAGLDKSTQAYVMQLQKNHADREIIEEKQTDTGTSDTPNGGTGARHSGDEGQSGDPSKAAVNAHYEIKGPPDTAETHMAKTRALIESNSYGAIGALASVFGATTHAPIAFNSDYDDSIGKNANDYNGHITGDHGGDSFGYNGLGMNGTANGGGGYWNGLGLGRVGDFGWGDGTGPGVGYGGGPGGKPMKHDVKTIKMPDTGVETIGSLPGDVIKRIVRANFPRFRSCYEAGLKKDPSLHGSVKVRFIIDNTGAVENASLAGGSMPDPNVSSCTLGVYQGLSFPSPENGKVMVTYPIDFENE